MHILEQVVKKEGQKINYSLLVASLSYLPTQDYSKKMSKSNEQEIGSALEEEVGEVPIESIEEKELKLPLDYSFLHSIFRDSQESISGLNYRGLVEDSLYKFSDDDEEKYESPSYAQSEETASTLEEARESMGEIKYADISTARDSYDHQEEERLTFWRILHAADFALYMSLFGLNQDASYGSL